MLQIKTILAPTDFSHHAESALRFACGIAERFSANLLLLHVLPEVMPIGPEPMLLAIPPPDFYSQTEHDARETLAKILNPDWGAPASTQTDVRWGDPVDAIIAHATVHAADLLVIATHGRSGLSHAILGSVAERIIRLAPCPVLTIRDQHPG